MAPAESVAVALSAWFVGFAIGGHDPSMVLVAVAGLKPFPVSDTEGCDAQPPSTAPARPIVTTTWTTDWRRCSSDCRRRPYRTIRLPRRTASRAERSLKPVQRRRSWPMPPPSPSPNRTEVLSLSAAATSPCMRTSVPGDRGQARSCEGRPLAADLRSAFVIRSRGTRVNAAEADVADRVA